MQILIFDLDQTLVCSKHRTPNNPDGTVNLDSYFNKRTRENIFKDTLLPLAHYMHEVMENGYITAICTARDMNQDDFDYLNEYNLIPNYIMQRADFRRRCPSYIPNKDKWTAQKLWQMIKEDSSIAGNSYLQNDASYKKEHLEVFCNLDIFDEKEFIFFDDSKPILEALKDWNPRLHMVDANMANKFLR